jgi:hypothetical protein
VGPPRPAGEKCRRLPPTEIYGNLWHGALTRNQGVFLIAGTLAFFVEFMFAAT